MLLSKKYNFIFFHTYKVAGTSIRSALRPYAKSNILNISYRDLGEFILKRRGIFYSKHLHTHITPAKAKQHIDSDSWNKAFKFSFVRNPWDWQVSLYHFMLQNPKHKQYLIAKSFKSFSEYIDWRVTKDLQLQKQYTHDKNGQQLVNYIGRFEDLQGSLDYITQHIGVPRIALPHLRKSKRKDYRSYYTDESAEKIAVAFREDIETFGYSFDGATI